MNDLARAVAMIIGPSMLLAVLVYLRVNTSEFDRYPYYLMLMAEIAYIYLEGREMRMALLLCDFLSLS